MPKEVDGVIVFDAAYWRRKQEEKKRAQERVEIGTNGDPSDGTRAERRRRARAEQKSPHSQPLKLKVGTDAEHVYMHFSVNLNFFGMKPEQALRIGTTLVNYAKDHPRYAGRKGGLIAGEEDDRTDDERKE
jgi:hypothetical protein